MRYIFVLLMIFVVGCINIQTPIRTYELAASTNNKPKVSSKKNTASALRSTQVTIAALLGIGAGSLLASIAALNMDDPSEEMAILFGVTGLSLWSVAGIIYLVEEDETGD